MRVVSSKEAAQLLKRDKHLTQKSQKIPKGLDKLVSDNEASIAYAVEIRKSCWDDLAHERLSDSVRKQRKLRIEVMTRDLDVLYEERRRLQMLVDMRKRQDKIDLIKVYAA